MGSKDCIRLVEWITLAEMKWTIRHFHPSPSRLLKKVTTNTQTKAIPPRLYTA